MSQSTSKDVKFAVLERLIKEGKSDEAKRFFESLETEPEKKPVVDGWKVDRKLWMFTRVTPANSYKLLDKMSQILALNQGFPLLAAKARKGDKLTFKEQVVLRHLTGDGLFKTNWRMVRSFALKKSLLWKYTGIVPRSLRCNRIDRKTAGGIQAAFFDFYSREDREWSEHFPQSTNGRTVAETKNSNE